MPNQLDKGFDALDTAAYSVRTIRPGYIYAYDEVLHGKQTAMETIQP